MLSKIKTDLTFIKNFLIAIFALNSTYRLVVLTLYLSIVTFGNIMVYFWLEYPYSICLPQVASTCNKIIIYNYNLKLYRGFQGSDTVQINQLLGWFSFLVWPSRWENFAHEEFQAKKCCLPVKISVALLLKTLSLKLLCFTVAGIQSDQWGSIVRWEYGGDLNLTKQSLTVIYPFESYILTGLHVKCTCTNKLN